MFLLLCNKDTNNDGKLNENDLLEIDLYDFNSSTMKRISKSPQHITKIDIIEKTKDVILTVEIDNRNEEQVILKRFNIDKLVFEDIIKPEIINELQKIFDSIKN